MPGLRETLAALGGLRQKFEKLLEGSRGTSTGAPEAELFRATRLREVSAFGANPGNLRMFVHAPDRVARAPALVVALHGCDQGAAEYARGSGWSTLADRHGFVVVYPEQQASNNPKTCFSWFLPDDIARNGGEALSIHQMVEHAIAEFGVDRRRVFVTGLSAGGAMASVMLATYPDVYAGGAIIAGLPYGCAGSLQEALQAMFSEQSPSARALGDSVRAASAHHGPWPRISVWHGSADPMVKPSNGEHIVRQWANVHGLSDSPARVETIAGHTRRVWNNANGHAVIEAFSIAGMAHGVPLETGMQAEGCGAVGPFFLDVGLSSTHHVARTWGLSDGLADAPGTHARPTKVPARASAAPAATELVARTGSGWTGSADALPGSGAARETTAVYGPSAVIAAAFKAAGLPVPEFPSLSPGARSHVSPGPIIAAALKAASLKRQ